MVSTKDPSPPPTPPPEPLRSPPPKDYELALYTAGLAASFGISHTSVINDNLTRLSPRVYPYFNVILPFGRCVFLLAIIEKLVR
jgi:hypothetical protein